MIFIPTTGLFLQSTSFPPTINDNLLPLQAPNALQAFRHTIHPSLFPDQKLLHHIHFFLTANNQGDPLMK